jgi:hypothetical protein
MEAAKAQTRSTDAACQGKGDLASCKFTLHIAPQDASQDRTAGISEMCCSNAGSEHKEAGDTDQQCS